MNTDMTTARDEWQRYWPLVLAASMGFAFMSFMAPAAGVFMEPVGHEFGWNRTQLSAGLAVSSGISLLLSPFLGLLLDRLGSRRLALPGLVATAITVSALSLANGSFPQWIGLWLAWGLASQFVQAMVWSTAIVSVFDRGRGLALGVTLSGAALAQVVAPPLANWLIGSQGWRAAFVWMGMGWGSFALLLCIFFLFDARDAARRSARSQGIAVAKADLPGLTIPQAWRSSELWRVGIATFLILTITIAVTVHQFPILTEAGVSRSSAAWLVSLSGMAGIAGKLITGTLIDRMHARWVGGITLASTAVAYPILMLPGQSTALIVLAMMISGYAGGTKIHLCGYLTARYGGVRNYGTIFGVVSSAIGLAATIGPLLAGWVHDHFGSYQPFLLAGTVISLLCGGIIFSLGRYPEWSEASPATGEAGLELPQ